MARTLDGLAIYNVGEATLTGTGSRSGSPCARATPSLASVLRVPPALGRWFTEEEGVPGAPPVAVLSHGLWVRRYGRRPRHRRPVGHAGRRADDRHRRHAAPSFAFPDRPRRCVDARAIHAGDGDRSSSTSTASRGCANGATIARARARLEPDRRQTLARSIAAQNVQTQLVSTATAAAGRDRRPSCGHAVDPAGLGRSGAARRVRERRQPVPGPLGGAAARGRRAPGARRGPPRHRALLPGRERAALGRRRRDRPGARLGRRASARGVRSHEPAAARGSSARRSRAGVHVRAERC